jgi:uncharacterized protein (TIGR03086 family)
MSTTADRFRTVAAGFTSRVEAVAADQWDNQSPCEDWTARDVVQHVCDVSGIFLGLIEREVPPGPSVADDPMGAWKTARDATQGALDDPTVAATEYVSPVFGPTTYEESVGRIQVSDVLIHTWDLARATGGDEKLDPDEVHRAFEALRPMDDALRGRGVFDDKRNAPAGADEQTQFLCFTGRRV